MAIKGIRNAKKVTNETIQEAAVGWMNTMSWSIQVGSMAFTVTHHNGIFFVHNGYGDLLRKFTVSSPLEVELGAIKRHNWTRELSCSECGINMFSIQNTNDECAPEQDEIVIDPDDIIPTEQVLAEIPSDPKLMGDFLEALKNF